MSKEIVWNAVIDGAAHKVCCVRSNNKYVLYLDDEHLTNIYRQSVSVMSDGFEEPVTVCGKACLFIVWDEKPDLVVDGVMLSRGIDYQEALSKRKKDFSVAYRIIFWAGVGLLSVMVFILSMGWGDAVGHDDIVFYTIAGAFMVLYGCSKTRWLTHPKNSPIISEENSEGANSK